MFAYAKLEITLHQAKFVIICFLQNRSRVCLFPSLTSSLKDTGVCCGMVPYSAETCHAQETDLALFPCARLICTFSPFLLFGFQLTQWIE